MEDNCNGLFLPTRSFPTYPVVFSCLPGWNWANRWAASLLSGSMCVVAVGLPLELAPSLVVVVVVVALQLLIFLAFSFWLLIVRIFPTLQYDTF